MANHTTIPIKKQMKLKEDRKTGSWKIEAEELEVGKQAQTTVNPVFREQVTKFVYYLDDQDPLVRGMYSGLIHVEDLTE
jgi:hypothetical protein